VETSRGADVVLSTLVPAPISVATDLGELSANGRLAVIRCDGNAPTSAIHVGGTALTLGEIELTSPYGILSGEIVDHGSEPGASWFDLDVEAARVEALTGQTLFAVAEDGPHGYAMRDIRRHGSGVRVFTKQDHTGFEARPAGRFEIPVTSCWECA
jgi:hypothetical protein